MARTKKITRKSKKAGIKIDYGRLFRPQAFGALLLALTCITLLALAFPGGFLGSQLNDSLRLLFGWGAYITPLVFLSFGLGLVWQYFDTNYKLRWQEAGGWFLLFVVCLAVLQIIALNPHPLLSGHSGGGYVGYEVYKGLVSIIGSVGAIAALLGLAAIGICLGFSISAGEVLGAVVSAVGAVTTWYRDILFPPVRADKARDPLKKNGTQPILSLPKLTGKPRPEKSSPNITNAPVVKEVSLPIDAVPLVRGEWELPPLTLLENVPKGELSTTDIRQKVTIIEETLGDFNVQARVIEVNQGPAVTQFGVEPRFHETRDKNGIVVRREKVKVSEITSLANDLALALAAPTIRIEAPVPGKNVVGIEVPNSSTSSVSLRGVIETEKYQKMKTKSKLAVALGEDVSGNPVVGDLAKMPHLLIAGATGSGKSVCLNTIISCFMLQSTPDEVRLLMIDPKRVELTHFNDVAHLLRPVVVEVEKAVNVLKWVTFEMDQRYKRFEKERVRNIDDFNKLMAKRDEPPMNYIVVIVDELADLMMTAPEEVEKTICRLAQLARATGIHLVVATQRPSVDVITGLIKANFPTRISFAMTSQVDSRTILDSTGAEKLLGRGDMLYLPADVPKPMRLQGVYVSDKEIEGIVSFWRAQGPAKYVDTLMNVQSWTPDGPDGEKDELYEKAVELARQHNHISTSLLQRRLRIGYSRAARVIDQMEEEGIVGTSEDGRSRQVLLKEETGAIDDVDPAIARTE